MTTTDVGAWNEMCALVRDALATAEVATLVGYTPELRYADRTYDKPVQNDKLWCRVSLIEGGEKKRTLSMPSRVTYQGVLDIQVFTPVADQRAAERSIKLASMLVTAVNKGTANVDLLMPSSRSMPKEDQWYYKRVNATYNYDVRQ